MSRTRSVDLIDECLYAYDDLNRLLQKTADPFFSTGACSGGVCGATQVSFTYNALGQRQTMTDASGTTNYTYDANNRLQHKVTPEGGLNYSYDNVGDVGEVFADNWNSGGVDTRYAYDALNRMSSVTALSDFGPIGNIVSNYTYDAVVNLATVAEKVAAKGLPTLRRMVPDGAKKQWILLMESHELLAK